MKTIIAGSRHISNYQYVKNAINLSKFHITEIISGNANGIDKLGEQFANDNNITLTIFPANWNKYGKAAGYKRNIQMAQYAQPNGQLIAIWDNISPGTKHMINIAKKYNLSIFVYNHITIPNSFDNFLD